jgi:glucose-1-phosphate cytidylyltransferase
MKVVILAGGFGTRISEESHLKPKPMIEIGEKPILWHIMKIYSHFGFDEFIVCLGYKGYHIKEYFANYFLHESDVTFDFKENKGPVIHTNTAEMWKVTLVNTGIDTMTGGRIKRVKRYIGAETFMLTYGDGVGNVNVAELLRFHRSHGKYATITAVRPPGRCGNLTIDEHENLISFEEKPHGDNSWINGGFFVLEPGIFDYIEGDNILWEKQPLVNLANDGQLVAFKHYGFWKPMDTLRDKRELDESWQSEKAEWKVWGKGD